MSKVASTGQQTAVWFYTVVDFHNAMPTRHDIDEGILQFLQWCMRYALLLNFDLLANHVPNTHLLRADADNSQAGSWRISDTIFHGDGSPLATVC